MKVPMQVAMTVWFVLCVCVVLAGIYKWIPGIASFIAIGVYFVGVVVISLAYTGRIVFLCEGMQFNLSKKGINVTQPQIAQPQAARPKKKKNPHAAKKKSEQVAIDVAEVIDKLDGSSSGEE